MTARGSRTNLARNVARFGTIGFALAAIVVAIVFPARRFEVVWGYLAVPAALPLLYSGVLRFIDPSIPFIVPVYSYTSVSISGSTPETVRHRRGSKEVHTTRTRAGLRLGLGLVFATVAIAMILFGASAGSEATTSGPQPRPLPASAPRASVPTTLAEALAVAPRSLALDSPLVSYASAKLAWTDVATADTTIGRALKDAEAERGKRLCASGTIDHIQRRDAGGRRVYTGRLETADRDVVDFVAVGTTGDLVKRSTGTVCGIVVGAPGEAVAVVGMFDLPENRRPIVEQ